MNKRNVMLFFLAIELLSSLLAAQDQRDIRVITVEEYCAFLTAEAMNDCTGLYDEKIGADSISVSSIIRSGCPGTYHYSVVLGKEKLPVCGISFSNAGCYVRWQGNEDTLFTAAEENSDEELKSSQRHFMMGGDLGGTIVQSSGEEIALTGWEEEGEWLIGLASLFWGGNRLTNQEREEREGQQLDSNENGTWRKDSDLDRNTEMNSSIGRDRLSHAENIHPRLGDALPIRDPSQKANFLGTPIVHEQREPLQKASNRLNIISSSCSKKEKVSTLTDYPMSVVSPMPTLTARKEGLQKAIHYAKEVIQYSEDIVKATLPVYRPMRLAKDHHRTAPLTKATGPVERAADALALAVTEMESRLTDLENSVHAADANAAHQDALALLELKLALTMAQEGIEKTQRAAEVAMDSERYEGTIATEALSSMRALRVAHEGFFNQAEAVTTTIPLQELSFSTSEARKEALYHRVQRAEVVAHYADKLNGEPAKHFTYALFACDTTEVTSDNIEQLSEAGNKVVIMLAISSLAIKNAKQHLEQWEASRGEHAFSSRQEEASIFAALERTTQKLKEFAKDFVSKIEIAHEYEDLWPLDVERTLTSLKAIQEAYQASLESFNKS